MRALLRWISLAGCAALLAVLGAAGTHQRSFTLFLVAVLGAAAVTVIVFVATAARDARD
jgi:ABC-type Fe3+-siderophore transport system permease subunit